MMSPLVAAVVYIQRFMALQASTDIVCVCMCVCLTTFYSLLSGPRRNGECLCKCKHVVSPLCKGLVLEIHSKVNLNVKFFVMCIFFMFLVSDLPSKCVFN